MCGTDTTEQKVPCVCAISWTTLLPAASQRQPASDLGLGLPGRQQVERAEFLRSVGGQGVGGVAACPAKRWWDI